MSCPWPEEKLRHVKKLQSWKIFATMCMLLLLLPAGVRAGLVGVRIMLTVELISCKTVKSDKFRTCFTFNIWEPVGSGFGSDSPTERLPEPNTKYQIRRLFYLDSNSCAFI